MSDGGARLAARVLARLAGAKPRVTLRVALDCVEGLAAAGAPMQSARTATSGVRLGNVRIADTGRARVVDVRDGTGAAWLVWELLAGRPAPEGELERLHDLVDDVPADVDDFILRAARDPARGGGFADADELVDALRLACDGASASHAEVADELALSPGPPAVVTREERLTLVAGPAVLVVGGHASVDPLERAIRDAGYVVSRRGDGVSGHEAARDLQPACIVVDHDLPGGGDAFALRLRREPAPLGHTPLLVLTLAADTRTRVARFDVGADVCVLKPYEVADVIAQLGALVRIAGRLREAREAAPRVERPSAAELSGDLADVPARALLTIVELERRTGTLELQRDGAAARLDVVAGRVARAAIDGAAVPPLDALRSVAGWTWGRFAFRAQAHVAPPQGAVAIGPALAELVAGGAPAAHAGARADHDPSFSDEPLS